MHQFRDDGVVSSCAAADITLLAQLLALGADGIQLFLEAETFDTELLMKQLKTKLAYIYGTAKNSDFA